MTKKFKNAFTLAEVLITLSIIGIVAALTIPGVVKHHNEKAWATGQDLFIKKLEVALKSMNTQGKLSGYTTTEDFLNELKKNIKINKICTDDVTKCFSKEIVWSNNDEAVTISNSAVKYNDAEGFDWAETVGVQFSNGVTALMAYNKNCYADAFDNQASVNYKCLGMVYDVTGYGKPNTNSKDIFANSNISSIGDINGSSEQVRINCNDILFGRSCAELPSGMVTVYMGEMSYADCQSTCTSNNVRMQNTDDIQRRCDDNVSYGWWHWVDTTGTGSTATAVYSLCTRIETFDKNRSFSCACIAN